LYLNHSLRLNHRDLIYLQMLQLRLDCCFRLVGKITERLCDIFGYLYFQFLLFFSFSFSFSLSFNYHASSYASSALAVVILSVYPSVCLSFCHTRVLSQNQTMHCGYFDTTQKDKHSSFLTPTQIGWRRFQAPLCLMFAFKVPHPLRKMPTSSDFCL